MTLHMDLIEAVSNLLTSLKWEEERSGTTYTGYEETRAAWTEAVAAREQYPHEN